MQSVLTNFDQMVDTPLSSVLLARYSNFASVVRMCSLSADDVVDASILVLASSEKRFLLDLALVRLFAGVQCDIASVNSAPMD